MELLLNSVWLLLALAAIGTLLRQTRNAHSTARPRLLLQVIALACILALLFPAISATDDLHASQLGVEACDVARKVLRSMAPVHSPATADWAHLLPALLLLALMAALQRKFVRIVVLSCSPLLHREIVLPLEGRAPPSQLWA